MDWKPNQAAAVSLTEALVKLSTEVPFRKVSETMENLLAGVLSRSTIHQLLGRISESAMEGEKEEYQASFRKGICQNQGRRRLRLFKQTLYGSPSARQTLGKLI